VCVLSGWSLLVGGWLSDLESVFEMNGCRGMEWQENEDEDDVGGDTDRQTEI